MGKFILILLVIGDFLFLFWGLKSKGIRNKEKRIWRIGCIIVLCLLLLTGVLEGIARYGIIVTILFIQVCVSLLTMRRNSKKPFRRGKTIGSFIANSIIYLLALLPAFIFPQYKPIPVTGDYKVEIATYTYEDENRLETYSDAGENRSVTVKFWYPDQEGDYPLVVFSHGAFGMIDSNYSTYMELASHGYVVASIGHPYHAMFVQDVNGNTTIVSSEFLNQINEMNAEVPEGGSYEDKEKTTYLNSQKWLAVRTGDMNFVLDTILENTVTVKEAPFSRIDKDKIGLFGHSLGGAASVQLGREREDIDAVIDLEGTMLGEYVGFENGTQVYNPEPYPIPLLEANSKEVHDLAMEVPEDGYVNFYVGKHALNYQEIIFPDAGHLNFTDLPVVSPPLASLLGVGSVDARDCMENVNNAVLTFFDYYLKGEGTLAIEK